MREAGSGTRDQGRGIGILFHRRRRAGVPGPWSLVLGPVRARAFTLVELLVAAAITAVMAGFIALMVGNVSKTWTRATGRLGADAQARIVLDQVQLDLQGALFREDGNVWMAIDVPNNQGTSTLWDNTNAAAARIKPTGGLSLQMNVSNIADARYGLNGAWLRFFTTSRGANSSTATVSAPVAVGYQIIRRPVATNTASANVARAYLLHRAEVRPGVNAAGRPGVLETGYTITAPAYTTPSTATNSGATTGDPRSIQVPGSNTSSPRNLDSVIGDNVIDFGVRAYVRDATQLGGLRLIYPATTTGALTNSPPPLQGRFPSDTPTTDPNYSPFALFPDVVDVMIRILTDEGAEQIAFIERNQTPAPVRPQKYTTDQAWWWGIAQENSRVYTRRVVLR